MSLKLYKSEHIIMCDGYSNTISMRPLYLDFDRWSPFCNSKCIKQDAAGM